MATFEEGLALLDANDPAAAAATFCRVLEERPDDPPVLFQLGHAISRLGETDLALSLMGQAIARDDGRPEWHTELGTLLERRGLIGDAIDAYREARRLAPENRNTELALAWLLAGDRQLVEAEALVADVLAADPGNAMASRVLGLVALRRGDAVGATTHLLAALHERPNDMEGLFLLGTANSPMTALVAATLWAFGVCFMWPTMLAAVARRYPRSGSWGIGIVNFSGALAIYLVLPEIGKFYDRAKIDKAGGEAAFNALQPGTPGMHEVLVHAAEVSFKTIAVVPVVLFFIFGVVWLIERRTRLSREVAPAE